MSYRMVAAAVGALMALGVLACTESRLAPTTNVAACPVSLDTTDSIVTPGYALIGAQPRLSIAGAAGPDSVATRCAVWATSSGAVLRVADGGAAVAAAPGLALVSARIGASIRTHQFVVLPQYDIVDLSRTLGDSVVPVALGNGGQLVGYHGVPSRPFFWRAGSITDLSCDPLDVNALDTVLCSGSTLWDHGTYRRVALPNDSANYVLNAIADNGTIAGTKGYSSGPSCRQSSTFVGNCACTYFYEVCVVIGRSGSLRTVVVGNEGVRSLHGPFINSRGDVLLSLAGHGVNYAMRFDSLGTPITTGRCGAFFQFEPVLGIDDARNVASGRGFCGPDSFVPYGPPLTTTGKDMSTDGRVVGSIGAFDDPNPLGFLWSNGFTIPLDSLLPGQSWKILSGNLVNSAGQIEATGRDRATNRVAALLLSPRP